MEGVRQIDRLLEDFGELVQVAGGVVHEFAFEVLCGLVQHAQF